MEFLRQKWGAATDRRPAVFLDRDGTLIKHQEVFASAEEILPFEGVGKALAHLQQQGYLLIVVTNQPNVEKGLNTEEQIQEQHEHLRGLLAKTGAIFDAAYACPHKYPSTCTCRKPEIGMIQAAQEDFDIDMEKSWLIGDTGRDMETGKRARLHTIQVLTGGDTDKHFDTKGEFTAKNFSEAVRFIKI